MFPVLRLLYYASDDLGAFRVDEIAEGGSDGTGGAAEACIQTTVRRFARRTIGRRGFRVRISTMIPLKYIDYLRRIGESVR